MWTKTEPSKEIEILKENYFDRMKHNSPMQVNIIHTLIGIFVVR